MFTRKLFWISPNPTNWNFSHQVFPIFRWPELGLGRFTDAQKLAGLPLQAIAHYTTDAFPPLIHPSTLPHIDRGIIGRAQPPLWGEWRYPQQGQEMTNWNFSITRSNVKFPLPFGTSCLIIADNLPAPARFFAQTIEYAGWSWLWGVFAQCMLTPVIPNPAGDPRRSKRQITPLFLVL